MPMRRASEKKAPAPGRSGIARGRLRGRAGLAGIATGLALLGLAALATSTGQGSTAEPPQPARPNIVLVLTDDLDTDPATLATLRQVQTRMAERGTGFANAFVPISLCCPSRASLLRGQYPHNHGIFSNFPPDGGFALFRKLGRESATVATALQRAGYRTVLLGKYLNGYPERGEATYVPPGWDEWYVPTSNAAYGGFHYKLNENGGLVSYGGDPDDYATDVLAGKASDFIERAAADGRPFFVVLSTFAPHRPAVPAPRHQFLFPEARAPRTPSFNEADVGDKPAQYRRIPPLGPGDIEYLDRLYRQRLQSLQAVDQAVAGLVKTLRATGQLGNTYIFFTSDNGHHLGQHRFPAGKYTSYEEDIRVPLWVRGPGVPAGRVVADLVLSIDLAPTFAELAGARLPQADGRSLVPLWSAASAAVSGGTGGAAGEATGGGTGGAATPVAWRRLVLIEQRPFGADLARGELEPFEAGEQAPWPPVNYAGLRTLTYKYVEYADGGREFYDLASDPYELRNRAKAMDAGFLGRLHKLLAGLRTCAGKSCRALDATVPPVP
jgi:N-acetylglucosamine-6-sulfatase